MFNHLDYLSQLFKETVDPWVGEAEIHDHPGLEETLSQCNG